MAARPAAMAAVTAAIHGSTEQLPWQQGQLPLAAQNSFHGSRAADMAAKTSCHGSRAAAVGAPASGLGARGRGSPRSWGSVGGGGDSKFTLLKPCGRLCLSTKRNLGSKRHSREACCSVLFFEGLDGLGSLAVRLGQAVRPVAVRVSDDGAVGLLA